MNEVSLEQLSAGSFAECIGSEFSASAAGIPQVGLELTAVTSPRTSDPDGSGSRYESFSLLFDGPANRPLVQCIYLFEHERIGRFDLFIVPVGNERGRWQYQAVFNRLRRNQ